MSAATRFSAYSCAVLFVVLLGAVRAAEPGKPADAAKANPTGEAARPAQAAETVKKPAPAAKPAAEPTKTAEPQPAKTPVADTAKTSAPAASTPAKTPVPDQAVRNPDFALQGEFVGPVSSGDASYERLALQIRPTGNGQFDAIQYRGGLPGERTHRPEAIKLMGKRWEKFLVLSGGPWAVFVEADHCLLIDPKGQRMGRLERVERQSPTLGAVPPKDAIVLFGGRETAQFTNARLTEDGLLMEGADVRPMFQDFNLHLEFLLPFLPGSHDQARANSGVYLQSRYELQILDSFAQEPTVNGCGSLYRFRKPDVNMCLPPLVWQTYDIVFTAPRWASDGTRLKPARITAWHNGVKIHDNVELAGKTGAGKPEEPTLLPIRLQDHKNPVRFRNIWLVDRGAAPPVGFPVLDSTTRPAAEAKPAPAKPVPARPAADADKSSAASAKP